MRPGEGKSRHQSEQKKTLDLNPGCITSCHETSGRSFPLWSLGPPSAERDTKTCSPSLARRLGLPAPLGPLWLLSSQLSRSRWDSGHPESCSIPSQNPLVSLSSRNSSSEARSQAHEVAPAFGTSRSGEGKQEGRAETTGRARPVWPWQGRGCRYGVGLGCFTVVGPVAESSGTSLNSKEEVFFFFFLWLSLSSPAHAIALLHLGKDERH